MRNVSDKFIETMQKRRDFYAEAEITFADGTKKTVSNGDLRFSGNSIVHSAGSSSFPLGLLVAKRVDIALNNENDQWSEYDFFGAKIQLFTRFKLDDGTIESINIGEFTVITPETSGATVQVTAMDDSYKTDIDYSTSLTYPLSIGVALRDACQTCGITLIKPSFSNSDFVIQSMPEKLTHRQFIGLCAMIAGGNAVLDEYNRLKIVTYDLSALSKTGLDGGYFDARSLSEYTTGDIADGGSFSPWDTGYVADGGAFGDRDGLHILYQIKSGMTIEVDDVVITGVQMQDEEGEVHLYGKEGYVISVENQLAAGKEDEAVQRIGDIIVGMRFRPFTAEHIAYPLAEFMDPAFIIDRKQNVYQTVLTDIEFKYFGFTTLKCTADSPLRNSSKYNSEAAKAVVAARKLVREERTAREEAVKNLADVLANSSGLYMTAQVQPDGSSIYYMHDKPTLEESMIIWKLTAEAFAISTDGGKTYPYGFTVDGELITRLLYAEGIDADYIDTGALRISDNSGNVLFYADYDTKQVRINAGNVYIGTNNITDNFVEMAAAISIANDNINLKVSKGDVSSQLSVESGAVSIKSDRFSWESTYSSLSADGKLKASDVEVSGKITADSGKIGGFKIEETCLYNGSEFAYFERDGVYVGKDGISTNGIMGLFSAKSDGSVRIGIGGASKVHIYNYILTTNYIDMTYKDINIKNHLYSNNTILGFDELTFGTYATISAKSSTLTLGDGSSSSAVEIKSLYGSIKLNKSGIYFGEYSSDRLGFFGTNPTTRKTVSKASTASTVTASQVATELNNLIDALQGYGLIS